MGDLRTEGKSPEAGSQITISPQVEEVFKRFAERLGEQASWIDEGSRGTHAGRKMFNRVMELCELAPKIAAEHNFGSEEAELLKLAIVASNVATSLSELANREEIIAGLSTRYRSGLDSLIQGKSHGFDPLIDRAQKLFNEVLAAERLQNQDWMKPEVALGKFLESVKAGKAEGISPEAAIEALSESFPNPKSLKGGTRFKPYTASFSKLSEEYVHTLQTTDTQLVLDCELALRSHPRFSAVGQALIDFFRSPIDPTLNSYSNFVYEDLCGSRTLGPALLKYSADKGVFDDRLRYLGLSLNIGQYNELVQAHFGNLRAA